jgi:hypothetical protein
MGGSGGGYFSGDIDATRRDLADAQKKARDEAYEAECNNLLASYLSDFNDRDREAISEHLEEIKEALDAELEGTVDMRYGGSVAKHTYVDGLSDVDSLVMLDSCELAEGSPSEAKEYLASRLRESFPGTAVSEGRLAVTVQFPDAEIQLLPAVSCQRHVKIASETGDSWSAIRPKEFTSVLTQVNQEKAGKVVPVVKLAKAIVGSLPERHRISGYHAESLAVALFRNYTGPLQSKEMLKHFFAEGAKRLNEPIRDRTGQSVHVDDYLGPSGSLERRIVSDAFARVGRRMNNADASGSTDEWRNLFGE